MPGARLYEQTLRHFFPSAPGEFPRFDFVLLGMGEDGHTSLFPHTDALSQDARCVVANWVEQPSTFRLTLTCPVLNHAAYVMFLINGRAKAEMVAKALNDPAAQLPCQRVAPLEGELAWYLDQQAGAKL